MSGDMVLTPSTHGVSAAAALPLTGMYKFERLFALTCWKLWRETRLDTHQIAARLKCQEHQVYNALARFRGQTTSSDLQLSLMEAGE